MGNFTSQHFNPVDDVKDMHGKVVIVTGGTGGIGLATVRHLLRKGAKVYLAARNESLATGAIARLEAEGVLKAEGAGQVEFLRLELEDPRGAQKVAEDFVKKESRLQAPHEMCADGVSKMANVNYVSHVAFTHTLVPLLQKTAREKDSDVRIVTVASTMNRMVPASTKFETFADLSPSYSNSWVSGFKRYGHSKLLQIMWSKKLQERLNTDPSAPITAIAIHPGGVDTYSHKFPLPWLSKPLVGLVLAGHEEGAYTSVFAAAGKKVAADRDTYKGVYLEHNPTGTIVVPNQVALDAERRDKLWKLTIDHLKGGLLSITYPSFGSTSIEHQSCPLLSLTLIRIFKTCTERWLSSQAESQRLPVFLLGSNFIDRRSHYSSGIGLATVRHFVRKGAKVYMASRNQSRATGAIAQLEAEGLFREQSAGSVLYHHCELNDPKEVKRSAEEFLRRETRLDVLVNNAAHYISPVVLVHTLMPLLKKTAQEAGSDVRIVNVVSYGHKLISAKGVKFDAIEDMRPQFAWSLSPWMMQYGHNKLMMVMWNIALQEKLDQDSAAPITMICLHPGAIDTFSHRTWFPVVVKWLVSFFMLEPPAGAYNSVFAAAAKKVRDNREEYKGSYLDSRPTGAIATPNPAALDRKLREDLWNVTAKFLSSIGLSIDF
ncbi:hypothetical protein CVT24_002450 [Panaeolus cyanescens]|uniref:Uncharacterized protein n=1 Tax=Panaeolus cyanescens TaxID=181874 RepID=A0A409YZ27_9AGAR|nr:hypothetical protein CVT24_002450 [Panaeolus cyanescens]